MLIFFLACCALIKQIDTLLRIRVIFSEPRGFVLDLHSYRSAAGADALSCRLFFSRGRKEDGRHSKSQRRDINKPLSTGIAVVIRGSPPPSYAYDLDLN